MIPCKDTALNDRKREPAKPGTKKNVDPLGPTCFRKPSLRTRGILRSTTVTSSLHEIPVYIVAETILPQVSIPEIIVVPNPWRGRMKAPKPEPSKNRTIGPDGEYLSIDKFPHVFQRILALRRNDTDIFCPIARILFQGNAWGDLGLADHE